MQISVIVPCFNEEDTVRAFEAALRGVCETQLPEYDMEILFVDDGSTDATLSIVKELAEKSNDIRYLSFSRNFGKEAAIYAGLQYATGNLVAMMDADLQDPPALLPKLVEAVTRSNEASCDIARVRRVNRSKEPIVRSVCARTFYRVINTISDTKIVDGARDYQVMKRCVVDAILSMGEYNRFFKGISSWVGFNTEWFEYQNEERVGGSSSWNFVGLVRYALEGISSFSSAPLLLASGAGIVCFLVALVLILFIVVRALLFGDPVPGWPSTACIILLIGGIQLLCIGILGQYVSRIYLEVKNRPIYVLRESNTEREADLHCEGSGTGPVGPGAARAHLRTSPGDGSARV